jgi:hypothetical protein
MPWPRASVYDNGGELQGQWSAGSLASNAAVEGIATNGADVWLVDSSADRVYRYNGVAGRLSDSQNAASSFSLNNGNKNPKDLVTDGAHIWVVDDSSTDKVFKYTLSGSLVGSWTITTSGAMSPTGITLDPASPSDLWIVDNATDRVYQYTGGVSWTSGNRSTAISFALAAGNTNPQGIADPPSSLERQTTAPLAVNLASGLPTEGSVASRRGASRLAKPHRTRWFERDLTLERWPGELSDAPAADHDREGIAMDARHDSRCDREGDDHTSLELAFESVFAIE